MCLDAMRSMYNYKDKPKYKTVGKLVALHPPRGFVSVYIPYVETHITMPLSALTQAIVSHCRLSLFQFPSTAVDRIVTFETLCQKCNIVSTVDLFLYWFHILPMNTDRNRVLIAGRAGFALFESLPDHVHGWRDLFLFVDLHCLGQIDPACPPPERWEPLDTLKIRTNYPPFTHNRR